VAEEHYGVEIYPGFAGAGLLFSEQEDADDPWTGWEGKWGKEVTKIGSSAIPSAGAFWSAFDSTSCLTLILCLSLYSMKVRRRSKASGELSPMMSASRV